MNTNKIKINPKIKPKIKSRFYINSTPLSIGSFIPLSDAILHHLLSVLRGKAGEYISLFNEVDGEYLCLISKLSKKEATVEVLSLIKEPKPVEFNIHLAYAPLKKDANDYALEKSCELGVSEVTQIITQNTVNKPTPLDKLTQKLTQASQQCERLDIPKVHNSTSLAKFLDAYKDKKIFWFYERGAEGENVPTFSDYLRANQGSKLTQLIILIGPEGGFAESEVSLLKSLDFMVQVHLNTNILRAETACVASLINAQVICCNF